MTSRVCFAARSFLAGVQKSHTPAGSGVCPALPSSIPHGCTMMTAVSGARMSVRHFDDAAGVVRIARPARPGPRRRPSTSGGAS